MISIVDFDTYYKIVGGASVLGILTQLLGFIKLSTEIQQLAKKVEETIEIDSIIKLPINMRKKHPTFFAKVDKISKDLRFLIFLVGLALATIVIYGIAKNITYLSGSPYYYYTLVTLSYVSLTFIPGLIFWYVVKFFLLYIEANQLYSNNLKV